MASSAWKLRALLKKNLLEMKRSIISTLCEIFFPIILMVLIYLLKTVFEINSFDFQSEEGSVENFIKTRSVYNLDTSSYVGMGANGTNAIPKTYGMSILPFLSICYRNKKIRKIIATIGVPEEIKEKLINESLYFSSKDFNLTNESFKDFDSEEKMNEYIKNINYGDSDDYPSLCFGISFSHDEEKSEYNYSLHYFENAQDDARYSDVPKSTYLIDPFQSGPDLTSYQKYQTSGYTYIMKLITEYIYSQAIGDDIKINFGIIPMEYTSYRTDPFGSVVGILGPFFIIIAYMFHLVTYVFRMVKEKESKVKEGMKIMGLTDGIYFLSYFIQYSIISIFDSLVNAIIFSYIFTKIPSLVFFFIFFLFALNIFALAFFFQSFIDKAKGSMIISLILYFIMFFMFMLVMDDETSYGMKIGFSIFPPVTIYLGIALLGNFQSHFRQFHLKDILYVFTNYSVLTMFIMLIADLLIYLFLGYYLQNILPHDFGVRRPWYFIFTPSYWGCKKKKKNLIIGENPPKEEKEELILDNQTNLNGNFESEDIYKEMLDPKDSIKIREIVKKFDDGKVAVNHVNLNLYKNEIFALLGHNGAGKTTLISMLTGLYEATEGEAIYDNMNILLPENMSIFREKIGICPQHDVLFSDLDIREHLGLFAIFKGVSSNEIELEINKIIKDFQLEDVQHTLAKNLSAGQRRKLSIAISLVGGSEIIFLDEPSSGMDITSRRNLWEILKRQCDNKIIILTTHYMEEASVLGKRIGIINLGKMKCIGTPLFLIERFGKYMNITLNKEEGAVNEKICQFITDKVGEAKYESLSEEILARIPKDCFNQENGMNLHNFFEELDENLNELKIKSYSVSMPTLEDVFLNVAQDEANERFSLRVDMQKTSSENNLLELNYLNKFSCCGKFCADFRTNFIRRLYLIIRDKKGFIMEVFCPVALILIGCIISQVNFSYSTKPFGSKDINRLGNQTIYYASLDKEINKDNYFINGLNNVTCKNLTEFDKYMDTNEAYAINQFIKVLYDKTKDLESTSEQEIDMNAAEYKGCYGNMLLLKEGNTNTDKNYEAVFVVNSRVIQGVPLYTSAFLEQIIKKGSNNKVSINYQHKVMGFTYEEEMQSNGSSSIIVFFVAIAYALIPANFISIIVRERNNNSKHLMKLSGMNMLSYWLTNFIYELIKFYFTGGICLLILFLFEYNTPYIIQFYFLYGPSLVFMTYAISFLFKDESNAQNKTILLHALIGALGSNVILILRQIDTTKSIGQFLEFIFCLLPSFCFSFAYNLGNSKDSIIMSEYGKEYVNDDNILMEEFLLLKGPYSFLVAEIFIYMFILIIEEAASNKAICCQRRLNINNNEIGRDSGVIREEQRAQTDKDISGGGNLINLNNENNYMIRVKNLQKEYHSCCCRNRNRAIKNLNFCLEKGECFGLLGLNGAGKTTTFKCITQELSPTYGEIFLDGTKTNNDFDSIKNKFGYCPQYDAIFEYMTVFENLEFYAKLKGVKREFLTQIINKVIYEMRLEEFIKKMAGRLSGGNKRKLSVAIAMLCSPPIILLDEPSTGMDPEARRFMWSSIHKLSIMGKKSSIIMTTHSMDEAETLCKRMGIMVNGEFVCLGRAHEIKDKYGYGYELNVRIKPMSEKLEDELFIKKYNLDNRIKVNMSNIGGILEQIQKKNYLDEIHEGRLGEKLIRDIEKSNGISINALLNWVFFVQNAIKLVQYGMDNFSKIIVEENMDNNFLFKMKKKEENNKSIGYLFGLFEIHKEECYVTEYSIQQTSLEQIFNKFAENQGSQLKERESTIVESGDVENIAMDSLQKRKTIMYDKIVVTDNLIKNLLDDE